MSANDIVIAARKVREHWRSQDGINGAVIDELCEAVESIGGAELLCVPTGDLVGDTREALRVGLATLRIGLIDLNGYEDDPSGARVEGKDFERALRELTKHVVRAMQTRSRLP